jgi:hypothetical protein
MARNYYKEPDATYGRPETAIEQSPPRGFYHYDGLMAQLDARGFLRALEKRLGEHDWQNRRDEWEFMTCDGKPPTDPDEINRFLCRPAAVSIVENTDDAAHYLKLKMILIAVDPNTPNLASRLKEQARAIRKRHPLSPRKRKGRPSGLEDNFGIDDQDLNQWRNHRIISLLDLILMGFDPSKERKQLAFWLFPEIEDQDARGKKFDNARKHLDQARAASRIVDAQTR